MVFKWDNKANTFSRLQMRVATSGSSATSRPNTRTSPAETTVSLYKFTAAKQAKSTRKINIYGFWFILKSRKRSFLLHSQNSTADSPVVLSLHTLPKRKKWTLIVNESVIEIKSQAS